MRGLNLEHIKSQVCLLLAAHPSGMKVRELCSGVAPVVSQPTMSRVLSSLRATGKVAALGNARTRRYHLVGGRLGLAELRSRKLHETAAARLSRDPGLMAKAKKRLADLRAAHPEAVRYLERWDRLMAGPMELLLRAMTEDSEVAADMRRASPFAGLVPKPERDRIFRMFSRGTV